MIISATKFRVIFIRQITWW